MRGLNFVGVLHAVRALLQYVDTRYHRVAISSFADAARLDHPLTHDTTQLYSVIANMQQGNDTNSQEGIEFADRYLRENSRSGRASDHDFLI